ncbi:MAG: hypothetical protein OEM05_13085 [Myxococcales bacterium]|nr:hypothetical protein [Myxococcales bacterium]
MRKSEGGDFVDHQSKIVHVSCIRCGGLHPVENALEFNPVCPTCTGR